MGPLVTRKKKHKQDRRSTPGILMQFINRKGQSCKSRNRIKDVSDFSLMKATINVFYLFSP